MKTTHTFSSPYLSLKWWWLLLFAFAFSNAQVNLEAPYTEHKPETQLHPELFWEVMAFVSENEYLEVKAFSTDGTAYSVSAIQYSEDSSILDVKVIIGNERLAVKLIMESDALAYAMHQSAYPLKGITKQGELLSIRAITHYGKALDVWSDRTPEGELSLNAFDEDGEFYPLFALSPDGMTNPLKAIKMIENPVEMTLYGIAVYAHVKAVSPVIIEEVL